MSTITISFVDSPQQIFITDSYNFVGSFFTIIQRQGTIMLTTAFPQSQITSIVIESQA